MAIIDNNHDFNAEAVDPIQGLDKQTLSLLDSNAPALCRCLGKKNLDTGMDFLEMLEYARNYAKTDGGHEVSEICRTIYKLTTSIRDPELDKGGKVKDMRNLESTFKMLKREVIRLQSQEDLEKSSSSIIDVVVEGTQNDAAATFEEKEGVLEEENEEDSEGFDPDKTMQGNDTMNYEQDLKVVVDPKLSAKRKSKVPTFDKGQVDAALQLQEDGMKSMQSMLKNISGMLVKN
ncbi:hypothetical protein HON22_00810, partial [Candidatus Peregrinibacteria bacterium]|nr:hypothetical protein [Candidatus Peregrinibacteria bacterium]